MVLDRKISVLTLEESEPGIYLWAAAKQTWAHMESQRKTNLFSKVGIGVKTVIFTLRKTSGITLHSALSYKDRQYFITNVNLDDPVMMVVTTADIQPSEYCAYRTAEHGGEHKSSVYTSDHIAQFPACVTEKYLGFKQEDPMARAEVTLVLVTPKEIMLEVHDIAKVGAPPVEGAEDTRPAYAVKVCHLLDEFKNEYEMTRKEDV